MATLCSVRSHSISMSSSCRATDKISPSLRYIGGHCLVRAAVAGSRLTRGLGQNEHVANISLLSNRRCMRLDARVGVSLHTELVVEHESQKRRVLLETWGTSGWVFMT